jgi:hypothetical protein
VWSAHLVPLERLRVRSGSLLHTVEEYLEWPPRARRSPGGRPAAGRPEHAGRAVAPGASGASRDAGAVTGATPRRSLGAFIPAVGRRWPRRSRQARKAAKKTRYATEPARASLGIPAKRLGKRVKVVQKVLGDHRTPSSRGMPCGTWPWRRTRRASPGFTWGLLHGQEQAVAKGREGELPTAWADASKPGCARRSFTERSLTSRLAGRK